VKKFETKRKKKLRKKRDALPPQYVCSVFLGQEKQKGEERGEKPVEEKEE